MLVWGLHFEIYATEWVLDMSDNDVDMNIDYHTFESRMATDVRLIITKKPKGIEPGVINFTVFGARA